MVMVGRSAIAQHVAQQHDAQAAGLLALRRECSRFQHVESSTERTMRETCATRISDNRQHRQDEMADRLDQILAQAPRSRLPARSWKWSAIHDQQQRRG